MLAIVANSFDQPSETFIHAHVRHLAAQRTVLLCQDDGGTQAFGCHVLSDLRGLADARNMKERIVNGLMFRWWRFIDPALRGPDEARTRRFLLRHNVRAVLAEFGPNGSLMRLACTRAGIPLYVHFHGQDATMLARKAHWRRHYRQLFKDATGVIVPSKFLGDRLHELGCPPEKINISANGVDLSEFKETVRRQGHILAVGRLVEKKAPHLTIRAFEQVHRLLPGTRLDIVGDGPLMLKCIEEIAELGLGGCVCLHGARDPAYVRALLFQAELFVQHSVTAPNGDMESFGVSLVEAMACSIPVVSTNHNGFSETVEHNRTGILVKEYDVDGMAEAMIRLLRDRSLSERMGRAGRDRVKDRFTSIDSIARLHRILGGP